MTLEQLEHVIRAAAAISGEDRIVILGSQAILGSYPDAPASLLTSMEVDAFPEGAPEKSEIIDGTIGELSPFHEAYGYYAHGIGPDAAILPENWASRLREVKSPATHGSIGLCISPADLAISKILAGRDKDIDFVRKMLSEHMVSTADLSALQHELCPRHAELLRQYIPLLTNAGPSVRP